MRPKFSLAKASGQSFGTSGDGLQGISSHMNRIPEADPSLHLEDHLCPGHALHNDLGVTGRSFPHHLRADGREIEQDHLQGVGVQQQLWSKASC